MSEFMSGRLHASRAAKTKATPLHSPVAAPQALPPIIRAATQAGGRALDKNTQQEMAARFGHDFSQVRIHTDARADVSAQAFGAHAYTVGTDIVFGEGRYAPGSLDGERLLAHELTHVVQQGRRGLGDGGRVSERGDASEREADQLAGPAAAGAAVQVSAAPNAVVARDEDESRWESWRDNPLWNLITHNSLSTAVTMGQMKAQQMAGGGAGAGIGAGNDAPVPGEPPRAVSDNMYEISADAPTDVSIGGRDNPARIMHHDNIDLEGVTDVTVADHAAVVEARAQIQAGGGAPEVGGLAQGGAETGSMLPPLAGKTTPVPLETRPASPNFGKPLDTQLRTHAENPALHDPANQNYNPDAYSANNPTTQINTDGPAAAGPKRYFDPETNTWGNPTAEAHMPAGGRDRGPTGLGETPETPAGMGEPGPGRLPPEPGEYNFYSQQNEMSSVLDPAGGPLLNPAGQPVEIGGPVHEVYGRPGDTLPASMEEDVDAILDPARYGAPSGPPPSGGGVPEGMGGVTAAEDVAEGAARGSSLWGAAGTALKGLNTVLTPLGLVSNAFSLWDDVRDGKKMDAVADGAGLASAGIGTADLLGVLGQTASKLNPVGAVLGAAAGGYAGGKYLYNNTEVGEDSVDSIGGIDSLLGGTPGHSKIAALDDYRQEQWDKGGWGYAKSVGAGIGEGAIATAGAIGGLGKGAWHGLESIGSRLFGSVDMAEMIQEQLGADAVSAQLAETMSANDTEQIGPSTSVAHEEMPPLPTQMLAPDQDPWR